MSLVNDFNYTRKDMEYCIIEGFHPLKHALRFDADVIGIYTNNSEKLLEMAKKFTPDLLSKISNYVIQVSDQVYQKLSKNPPKTGVIAIARKPKYNLESVIKNYGKIVFLENIRSLDNLGAVVRVAAARGVAGVLVSGTIDPFHSTCIRASRGLHFAVPVVRVSELPKISRCIIVFDENGEDFRNHSTPENCILVFGSERNGVSARIKKRADNVLRIPMRPKVSSLNIATSASIVLYS